MDERLPVDQAARDLIATATDRTLFVEAGAGAGKTKALVDRISRLVLHDRIPLSSIAAVTFTEKAGAELRDRLRTSLERSRRSAVGDHVALVDAALDDLDSAAFGTLHAFALRVLTTYPIQSGLPPLVQVLDEVASSVSAEARWRSDYRALLDDAEMSAAVLFALGVGIKSDQLRSLARAFGSDWDLIEARVLHARLHSARHGGVASAQDTRPLRGWRPRARRRPALERNREPLQDPGGGRRHRDPGHGLRQDEAR
ncbi:AAA family ATPase [Schumannella sp. 10F1B-5-1]|nr:AAA family ATPase [Schumannella sp. 10F1B-5-1]